MKRFLLAAALATGCMGTSFAQTDSTAKVKTVDQYIGVQMNLLIQQVFNFNNNNTAGANNNPYLVNYSLNSRKSGWGFRVGLGYNYTSNTTDDGITKTTTRLNDLSARVGLDRAFALSKKWSAGAGLDFVISVNSDHAITTDEFVGGGTADSSDVKTTTTTYGGGAMGWLRYHVTKNVLIGTESSFYFTSGKTKQTIYDSNAGGGTPATTTSNSNNTANGTFSVPVTFYLIVKF